MTQPAQQPTASSSTLQKVFLAVSFAAFLALAPSPALAQHGGGGGSSGGGGGSHGGGGGGGGSSSHGGGASSAGHASSGGHVSTGSHPTSAATGGNPANPNGGGHWWNPFHGNSSSEAARGGANSAAAKDSNAAKVTNAPRFAAGNNIWQDPPPTARTNVPSNHFAAANHAATSANRPVRNSVRNAPREEFSFRHHHPPVGIFNPYFFSPYGYGFGFGCDPLWVWGCSQFGLGFGYGFGYGAAFGYGGFGNGWDLGYYNGGGYGSGYGGSDSDMTFDAMGPSSAPDDAPSREGNSGDWQDAPAANNSQATDASGNNGNAQQYVVIVLRDGSSYAVSDYWLAGGKLYYITSYGGENSVDLNQLDLERTVNDNATRGIEFTLRPTPGTNPQSDQRTPQPQPAPPADRRPQTPAPSPQ
jgi:hypothetical protein